MGTVKIATSTAVDVSGRLQQGSWALSVECVARIEADLNEIGRIVGLLRFSAEGAVANCYGIVSWQRTRSNSAVQNRALLLFILKASNIAGIVVVL